ncbi:unnamed protein product [Prunus armeniaca]|uniref:Uncharacterized protein n=1 Tax=Prunus armeniaca TaxID=36596 RepID=A0A6J5TI06_PRUAR|nr:unnamed protein product [Prunus armeniaca]CAB4294029.1 unnamed protein product [Prunus armeniaca]
MEIKEDIGDQSSEGGSGVNFRKPMLRPSSLGSGVEGDHLPLITYKLHLGLYNLHLSTYKLHMSTYKMQLFFNKMQLFFHKIFQGLHLQLVFKWSLRSACGH